ncbi:thiol-disulfide oxidoreductase DCC family protein [Anaerobacillus alkaliphilus]|uniref:Thiol-disulfide oxidoreductase DCC family protein n=1 Tax=Anaerobacillus alkaliphilus TaxID=1548597 RepID=A0A4Q0W002_9BACI|nr:thiol-disulfide oxidoreductase DCC family protein [Anaerobacillus alkaliphilus]RXJ04141.1 thiol-disulfide oxidoreductase DCC family protein [Anaerobacillus alkaliphilus]
MTVAYKAVVLFDGVCNFCNSSVQFIIERDQKGYFQFASLQSEIGQKLVAEYGVPKQIESLVLIEGGQYYLKSTAALRICRKLSGFWKALSIFLIVPSLVRNIFYDFIARNRYKWFGKKTACTLPSPEIRKRFLE